MLMTTLAGYHVRPGRLREWTLDAAPFEEASRTAGGATPLSYNQQLHLTFSLKLVERGLGAPAWLGFGFEIPGPLDTEVFRETVRAWAERHETLRSGFRLEGGKPERFTVGSHAVSVRDAPLGDFTSGEELRAYLQERIDGATEAFRLPSLVVETVERADSTTVVVGVDHAHADGYSVAMAVQELQDLYAAIAAGETVVHDGIGSYVDYGVMERAAVEQVGTDHPAVVDWSRFVADSGGRLPRFPLDLGVTDGELVPHTMLDTWLVDAAEAEAVEEVCHAADGGFLAGLLTAFAIAAHQFTGARVYRTVMPMHTRSRQEWARSMGWFIGLGPVEIDLGTARTFQDAVHGAHRSTRAAMSRTRVPFLRVVELLGLEGDLERAMPEFFSFVSFTDMRVIPGARRWPEWNARTLFRLTRGNKANIWLNRTHDGVRFTARHPDTELAGIGVACFADRVRDVLHSVAKTGDYAFADDPSITTGDTA
ncbi:condensation domain-containing protein [Streptomyces sp. NPDC051173]|uniref:condensation domain-containing protein n=1 Tax=Streptomyces sp. NPDC051173 TaxID=3155164 RepID=UPI00344BACD3